MGLGIMAGLMAGALWGLVFVAPRMLPAMAPVDLTAGRFVSYGLLSLVLMLVLRVTRADPWPTASQAAAALAMSVLGFTGYYLLLVYGIGDAGTEVPTLIIGTIPLWMMLLGKPSGLRWQRLLPGLALTACGLGLMISASYALVQPHWAGQAFGRGVMYSLGAMLCWTVFGLLNARWLQRHPEIDATTWANWLGVATGLGALLIWTAQGSAIDDLLAHADIHFAVVVMVASGVGSAWLATILWNIASQRLSASLCGQLIVSETIFALVYSFVWDGHAPTALQLLACLLFIAGILYSVRVHR